MNYIYIVILTVLSVLTIGLIISVIYLINLTNNISKKINSEKPQPANQTLDNIRMSFEDCDKYIENVINDIWQNKYFMNYRLRDLVMIPEMDKEIESFTKDVMEAIGNRVMIELLKFYSYEYIIRKITRKAQVLFIDYTNNFKPSTK